MGDSCVGNALIAAVFGGVFGTLTAAVTSTYTSELVPTTRAQAIRQIGKTGVQYAAVTTTFTGAYCASEALSSQKGPHNAVFGGVAAGAVAALMKNNVKFGLAFGGVTALAMGALELSGGTLSTRGEATIQRFNMMPDSGKSSA